MGLVVEIPGVALALFDLMRSLLLLAQLLCASAYHATLPVRCGHVQRATPVTMINLFGNNEESKKRRDALSDRYAKAGDRKVTLRKPNAATSTLQLGLKFREGMGKSVYIDKI